MQSMESVEKWSELFGSEPPATSLVEEDQLRISGLIDADFTQSANGDTRSIMRAAVLLESHRLPVVFAAQDCGYIEDSTQDVMRAAGNLRYSLNQEQLQVINKHRYVRTLALSEIVQVINVEGNLIHDVVEEMGMEPAVPEGIIRSRYYYMNRDRYDKDQIVALHAYLKERLSPPTDAISEDKFVAVTKVSDGALRDVERIVGASPTWYKDPQDGRGRRYLSPEDALKVLRYVKDPEYRKTFQAT